MPKDPLRFDDRVVIVTGAGQGLGRAHALDFASRGARVVVNDLGGAANGGGGDGSVAQSVVDEITAAGGIAVASTDSVEDGDKIVQAAMDHFGRVDVVVNNAGILRDVSFAKMTDADWDVVDQVHLRGSYAVSHAAWPHMRAQRFGRIVMTTSVSGIYGSFGQANYAAAKMGLIGLAQTLSLEGASRNILVNSIAPTAASRLTATVLPEDVLDVLRPEYVTPCVVMLSHESSDITGKLFEVGGGWICQVRWEQTEGAFFDEPFDAEQLSARWSEVTDFSRSRHASSVAEVKTGVLERTGQPMILTPQP
tara:strand:- start:391 stop:1314 length:924 start_codon:yes stop_codon:yes gene_type:complete